MAKKKVEPVTRKEMFLDAAAEKSTNLPTPITREEIYLAKAAGVDVEIPEPITRQEVFLKAVADNSVKPTGKISITNTDETDVTNYATAQVVDDNLIADNIKDGVEILGITGTYGGGSTPPETPTDALLFYSPNEIGLSIANATKNWNGSLYYSTDYTNWTEWDGTTLIVSVLNGSWHTIYLRGVGNTQITAESMNSRFVIGGGAIKCIGNCNNLLDYTTEPTLGSGAFQYLFYNCGNVDFDVELPSTTLSSRCYSEMFRGCSSLTKAPNLPATGFGYNQNCYARMFQDCVSLVVPPSLPATTTQSGSYNYMFSGCISLSALPELISSSYNGSCQYMFYGCSKIKLSTEQIGEYQTPYRIPSSGTGSVQASALSEMFTNTGGTFRGTPTINTTYYTSNTVISAE